MAPARVVSLRAAARIAASVASKGIYPVPSVARILHERNRTIDRWALGYARRGKRYEPAVTTDIPPMGSEHVLTFLELVELMFIQAALKSGLSWRKVRDASRVAARLLKNEPHPFAAKRWFADPAGLYLKLGEENEEEILVEVAGHAQVSMEPILAPYLQQLVFDLRGVAQQWYPNGVGSHIVLDPRRAFGHPVTTKGGIPTDTIAALHSAGDSIESIAAWFRTDEAEVAAAVDYERSLDKAA